MNLADRAEQFLGKGIREVAGPTSHPQILSWLKRTERLYSTDLKIDDSTYSWCGVFVGSMVLDGIAAGEKLPSPPRYFQRAASWGSWGRPVLLGKGKRGDVVVTHRPGGHHVTFITSVAKGGYNCTGGNQGDSVSTKFFPFNQIIAIREP